MGEKHRDEVEEIKDFLLADKPKKKTSSAIIFFDGKQYSIRIPKKIVEVLKFDVKKDHFDFVLTIPPYESKEKPSLEGYLVRGE